MYFMLPIQWTFLQSIYLLTYLLTYSMQQSPYWEANWSSINQKTHPHFIWPQGSLLYSQVPATCPYPEPVRSSSYLPYPTSWRFILKLSSYLRLGLPSCLFPSGFTTKTLYTLLLSPISTTCPANFIILDVIIRIILGEGNSLQSIY